VVVGAGDYDVETTELPELTPRPVERMQTFIPTEDGSLQAISHHRHTLFKQGSRSDQGILQHLRELTLTIAFVLRINTVLVTASGILATWIWNHEEWGLGLALNIPLSIVSFGVFFPLAFVIGAVYKRRDQAAVVIASMKAAATGLALMARDWDETFDNGLTGKNAGKPHRITETGGQSLGRGVGGKIYRDITGVLAHFLDQVHAFLYHKNDLTRRPLEREVYRSIHTLSVMCEEMRGQAGYGKGGEGGMSRSAQFITYLVRHFEELRTWREYRSPYGLRYTIALCTHILPAALAPMWRFYALQKPSGERSDAPRDVDGHITAYVSVTLFSVILMTLFNVYRDLEDPFDENGWDDLKSEWPMEWVRDMQLSPHSSDEIAAIIKAENWFRHKNEPKQSPYEYVVQGSSRRRASSVSDEFRG